MKIEFEIDEKEIAESVKNEIVKQIMTNQMHWADYGVRDGIAEGVKQYVYTNKEAIIEKVTERASKEIIRKGIPRLLEKLKGDS